MKKPAYPFPDRLDCKACGKLVVAELSWQRFRNGTIHLRAACAVCGRYLGYVHQTPKSIAAAPPMPRP